MEQRIFRSIVAVLAVLALSVAAQAVVYSPTQAELNLLEFIDYWPGNGASLDSKANVAAQGTNPNPGVKYTFDTGGALPTPDGFGTRTQFETPAGMFTHDFSTFDSFDVNFLLNASSNPLQARTYLLYNGGRADATPLAINGTTQTRVTVPMATIPLAGRSQITGFGVEIFSLDDLFHNPEANAMASAYTAQQPPNFVDTFVISDFEAAGGAGSLDGWGAGSQPDHVHSVVASTPALLDHPANNGVTQGTHALEILRHRTGADFPAGTGNSSFRWGSQMQLSAAGTPINGDYNNDGTVNAADYTRWRDNLNSTTANLPNDPTPTIVNQADYTTWKTNFGQTSPTNPAIQTQINQIVDAINAGDQIAFDVSFFNKDNFPNSQPGYLGYHMFITDGSARYWQSDDLGFPSLPAVGASYDGLTLAVPLTSFTDRSAMPVSGTLATNDLQKGTTFTIGLATNTGVGGTPDTSVFDVTIQIDNVRVRRNAAVGGAALAAVPEPTTLVIAILASVLGTVASRRRA